MICQQVLAKNILLLELKVDAGHQNDGLDCLTSSPLPVTGA